MVNQHQRSLETNLMSIGFMVFIKSFILLWNTQKAFNDIPSMMVFHSVLFFLTRAWSASTFAVTLFSCFISSSRYVLSNFLHISFLTYPSSHKVIIVPWHEGHLLHQVFGIFLFIVHR